MKRIDCALVALVFAALSSVAHSATLTGDTITKVISSDLLNFTERNIGVGASIDEIDALVFYDFNTGSDDNELLIEIAGMGGSAGLYAATGTTSIRLESLNFTHNQRLVGFDFLEPPQLDVMVNVLSSSAIEFTYSEGRVTAGTFLRGQFLTAPIPLPPPALLLLTALGLLGLARHAVRR